MRNIKMLRLILLVSVWSTKTGYMEPISISDRERDGTDSFSLNSFTFNDFTTRSSDSRLPSRAGEKNCVTCQVASDLLTPYCQNEGPFAHFVSCKQYYYCDAISDVPVELKCRDGELFDRETARCRPERQVSCPNNQISFGSFRNEVIGFRSQTPVIRLRPTRPALLDNRRIQFRDNTFNDIPSDDKGPVSFNVKGHVQSLSFREDDSFVCPGDGYFTDPNDCSMFYSCFPSGKSKFSCPADLYFSQNLGVCDYQINVPCDTHVEPTQPPPTQPTEPTIPTQPPTLPPITVAPDTGLKKVCYYTNWARYRPEPGNFVPADIDPSLCTHVNYAFAVLDAKTYKIELHDSWSDIDLMGFKMVTDLKSAGIKVLLALGGWTDSSGSKYSELVANEIRRSEFIADLIPFLKEHKFDGMDLDWEFPKCWQSNCVGPAEDKMNFATFVREVRAAFDQQNPRMLLTAAVSANPNIANQAYDIQSLSRDLDFFNLMAYDYHGSWETTTGHVAPHFASPQDANKEFNVDSSITYYLDAGAPKSKIVVGIPTYGRSFTLQNANNVGFNVPATGGGIAGETSRESGMLSYTEICSRIEDRGWIKVRGNDNVGPYAYSGRQWVGYYDIKSIIKLGLYIMDRGLGGAMYWTLDFDDFNSQCCSVASPLLSTMEKLFSGDGPGAESILAQCGQSGIDQSEVPTGGGGGSTGGGGGSTGGGGGSTGGGGGGTVDQCFDETVEYYPDSTSCYHFYQCANLRGIRMTCPSDLHWNQGIISCDWPANVNCQI